MNFSSAPYNSVRVAESYKSTVARRATLQTVLLLEWRNHCPPLTQPKTLTGRASCQVMRRLWGTAVNSCSSLWRATTGRHRHGCLQRRADQLNSGNNSNLWHSTGEEQHYSSMSCYLQLVVRIFSFVLLWAVHYVYTYLQSSRGFEGGFQKILFHACPWQDWNQIKISDYKISTLI